MTDEDTETTSKVIDLMAALKESLSPGAPEKAAEMIVGVGPDADAERVTSPDDTTGWLTERVDGIETFTATDGEKFVRARAAEAADVIVVFTRTPGLSPLRLVSTESSQAVKAAARKKRREERELRKRGYTV